MLKQSYHLDHAMNSLIKTAEFQGNFTPNQHIKLAQYDTSLDSVILQLADLSNRMEKLGGLNASQQLLKIAQSILDDYNLGEQNHTEICDTCGFDHEYDIAYPGVKEQIEKAHKAESFMPFSDEDDAIYGDMADKNRPHDPRGWAGWTGEDFGSANDYGDMLQTSDEVVEEEGK